MIIHPGRRLREVVRPAVLANEHEAQTEDGQLIPLDKVDSSIRVFAPWDQVDEYARAGVGELVLWGEDPIRWRHRIRGDSHRRHGEVVIVKLACPSGYRFHDGLVRWADWLNSNAATIGWSLGGTSMSVLRATLQAELVTTNGELPRPLWTLGGRQQCWMEPGVVHDVVHLDLTAAYTTTVSQLRYGGVWRKVDRPEWSRLDLYETGNLPTLVHGRVRLPCDGVEVGPLAHRPRRKPEITAIVAPRVPYPVQGSFTGLFTLEEVRTAVDVGARFTCDAAYVHANGRYVFADWFDAICEGRALPGFAGALAKANGNALWGQFVIDDANRLAVQTYSSGKPRRRTVFASKGHQRRAWDVGELVCGRVRAQLYEALALNAGRLVCCHTDGLWTVEPGVAPGDGWRVKERAQVMEFIDQQKHRIVDGRGRSKVVMSGVPQSRAMETFARLWAGYENGRDSGQTAAA